MHNAFADQLGIQRFGHIIQQHDKFIAAENNPFVDGVFVPKSETAMIASTGLKVSDLPSTSGQTWDYLKDGSSYGFTVATIDGLDFAKEDRHKRGGFAFVFYQLPDAID